MKPDKPLRMWSGTIVLNCPPCSWSKCIFCGFSSECLSFAQPSTDGFLHQFKCYFDKYGTNEHLEIYNSGSFLDDEQISSDSRTAILEELTKRGIRSIAIESRPEYVSREKLAPILEAYKVDLLVAIGLEAADDVLLEKLNKGFTLYDVEKAHSLLKEMGISSRAYILVGPPFANDYKLSALQSVEYAKSLGFDEISVLAAYPMKGSPAYKLWEKEQWCPLNGDEFEKIIESAKNIEPKIDYSSDGLKKFWKEKGHEKQMRSCCP